MSYLHEVDVENYAEELQQVEHHPVVGGLYADEVGEVIGVILVQLGFAGRVPVEEAELEEETDANDDLAGEIITKTNKKMVLYQRFLDV